MSLNKLIKVANYYNIKYSFDSSDARDGALRYMRQYYPNLPQYVFKDFIGQAHKSDPEHMEDFLNFEKDLNNKVWKKEILELNFSDFSANSKERMLMRDFGKVNPFQVPNDESRMETQKNIVKGDGNNEPVILIYQPDGFELLEGWHRTMNLLLLGNNGSSPEEWDKVKIKAWVAYPP